MNQIKRAFIIWMYYLLFSKQNELFTTLSIVLLSLSYILHTFEIYHKNKNENENKNENTTILLNKYKNYSFISGILTIIFGFMFYIYSKYKEYGNNFNILTFIFGKISCDSLHS
jgi:Ca2+/Na+ antiporter